MTARVLGGVVVVALTALVSFEVTSPVTAPTVRPPAAPFSPPATAAYSPPATAAYSPPVAMPLTGSVLLDRGGKNLFYTEPDRCVQPRLTATETATEVRLSYSVARGLTTCDRLDPYEGQERPPLWQGLLVYVHLADRLGVRTVVDAVTGRPMPVIALTDVPTLVVLPGGWDGGRHAGIASAFSDFGGPGTATAAVGYGLKLRDRPTTVDAMLWVVATTGGWHPPTGTATTPVRVRGVAGRAAPGIVVWTVGRFTYAVRWDPPPDLPLPTTEALVTIANSLTPGHS